MTIPCGIQVVAAGGADTAIGLTLPSFANQTSGQPYPEGTATRPPVYCLIICETQAIRWRDDGIAPTAGAGMPIQPNTPFLYDGDLKGFQMISAVAGAAVTIAYYY